MRLAQKVLLLKMRAKFPVDCNTEDRRQEYLQYFERESLKAVSCQSDSDDDFDLGQAIWSPTPITSSTPDVSSTMTRRSA